MESSTFGLGPSEFCKRSEVQHHRRGQGSKRVEILDFLNPFSVVDLFT